MIVLKENRLFKFHTIQEVEEFITKLERIGCSVNMRSTSVELCRDDRVCFIQNINAFGRYDVRLIAEEPNRFVDDFLKTLHEYRHDDEFCISYDELLNSGKYFSKTDLLDCDTGEIAYAKNSALHNKIMMDGNVFNPYIHRRFLPHQYIKMIEQYEGCINNAIMREYTHGYVLKYMLKEVKTLATLLRIDRKTFRERSRFFTYDVVYSTVKDFVEIMKKKFKDRTVYYDSGFGFLNLAEIKKLLFECDEILNKIVSANSYSKLYEILSESRVYEVMTKAGYYSYNDNRSQKWINAFKASGAYYTMKHLIMFEGYLFRPDQTSEEAIKELEMQLKTINADNLHSNCISLLHNNFRISVE